MGANRKQQMMSTWFLFLCQFSVLAFAIVGGVFLAFSDFIMRSLDRANTPDGINVMQVINREVFKYVFIPLFLGMTAVSLVIVGYAYMHLTGLAATLIIIGAGIYIVGVFGVTVVFNVPMNKRLAAAEYTSDAALSYWKSTYLPSWTFWNSVRTIASVAAAGCLLSVLVWLTRG